MNNTVRCIDCAHFRLREAERMAENGFGLCEKKGKHEFMSATYLRQCRWWDRADDETVAAREAWLGKRGEAKR